MPEHRKTAGASPHDGDRFSQSYCCSVSLRLDYVSLVHRSNTNPVFQQIRQEMHLKNEYPINQNATLHLKQHVDNKISN